MKEGEILLGKVENVSSTVTTVRLPDGKTGTIISSEIAPGRIKHMRHHVVPNKKIAVKVLEIVNNHIHLSLRRVNSKEKKDLMQKYKQNQAIKVAFKNLLGSDAENIRQKILVKFTNLSEFIDKAKIDKKLYIKFIPKEKVEQIKKIAEKRKRNLELIQNVKITCLEDDGMKKIKEIFKNSDGDIQITYISAGNFKLRLAVDDFKTGKKKMHDLLEEMEKTAKKNHCEFSAHEER